MGVLSAIAMKHNVGGSRFSTYLVLCLTLAGVFILDLSTGSVNIPVKEMITIVVGGEPQKASWTTIFWLFRLPKAITAMLAGAGLAVSGLFMQTLFRNPLAGPSVLGINAGASLGVALIVLSAASTGTGADFLHGLGLVEDVGLVAAASVGAALVLLLILVFARKVRSVMTLLIVGILFGYMTNAVVSVLIHFSIAERIHAYISWTFGSFAATTWRQLRVFIPVVLLGLGMTIFVRKPLNALLLGESYARSMGLHIKRARAVIIVNTAILSGVITAFCGPIAFLGVAIPHLCRTVFNTSDHRVLLPTVMLVGAIVALVADLVAQLPGSQHLLPLNAVTSLIGAPLIVWFILRKNNMNETFAA